MGDYQNYGPFLGTLNIRCRIIIGTQKETIISTTTHMFSYLYLPLLAYRMIGRKGLVSDFIFVRASEDPDTVEA